LARPTSQGEGGDTEVLEVGASLGPWASTRQGTEDSTTGKTSDSAEADPVAELALLQYKISA